MIFKEGAVENLGAIRSALSWTEQAVPRHGGIGELRRWFSSERIGIE